MGYAGAECILLGAVSVKATNLDQPHDMKSFLLIVVIVVIAAIATMLVGALMFALPREDACQARSVAELKAKFEQSFASKDEDAFLSLFHWAGMESEWREAMRRELSAMLSSALIRAELRDADVSKIDAEEMKARSLHLNIAPVSTLYFERSVGPKMADPRQKTSGRLAIGKVGTCYAFGAYDIKPLAPRSARDP